MPSPGAGGTGSGHGGAPTSKEEALSVTDGAAPPAGSTSGSTQPASPAGSGAAAAVQKTAKPSVLQRVAQFVSKQYLPCALTTALIVGYLQPAWGVAASRTPLSNISAFLIFLCAGLSVRRGQALEALRSYGGWLSGAVWPLRRCVHLAPEAMRASPTCRALMDM